ncbi:MAG: FKBP-type peptidyl-prolyl cis-trans isomerase [Deltaproteobacteria bacterium]|nr:FKBP-type peptidyl-prolyl cis-trans isomerase [Deltaproteobacteria bacterium]
MKYPLLTALAVILLFNTGSAAETPKIEDEKDRVNYSLGYQIGEDLKRQGVELQSELIVKGIRDAISGTSPLMTPQDMRTVLVDLKKRIEKTERERLLKDSGKNLAEGEVFLSENARKEGVQVLPSGLQYRVVREGSGASPKATDTVTVNYRGMHIDGTEFDSSYKRNKPAIFRVDRVIRGWTEALQLMKEGAKWELSIPAKLAYGERGAGTGIPPNSALIFDVELIAVGGSEK